MRTPDQCAAFSGSRDLRGQLSGSQTGCGGCLPSLVTDVTPQIGVQRRLPARIMGSAMTSRLVWTHVSPAFLPSPPRRCSRAEALRAPNQSSMAHRGKNRCRGRAEPGPGLRYVPAFGEACPRAFRPRSTGPPILAYTPSPPLGASERSRRGASCTSAPGHRRRVRGQSSFATCRRGCCLEGPVDGAASSTRQRCRARRLPRITKGPTSPPLRRHGLGHHRPAGRAPQLPLLAQLGAREP